ncbi:MAG: peptidylprolyl isomerase [bacterium]
MHKSIKRLMAIGLVVILAVVAYYVYDTFIHQRSVAERIADIIYAEDTRRLTPPLRGAVSDSIPLVRARAAMALGRVGGSEAAGILDSMIEDSSIDVMSAACFGLGLTGRKQYASLLMDRAFDLPSAAAAQAVASIGRLADSSMANVIEHLPDFLAHPSPDVREAACLALLDAGAKSEADKLINYVGKESDEPARAAGIYALARLGIKEARDVFIDNLVDADPFVRQACLRGLGSADDKDAIHAMAVALNDGDDNVVVEAIGQLANTDKSKAESHLLKKLPKTTRDHLKVTMLDAFRKRKSEAALEWSRLLLAEQPTAWVTSAAVQYEAAVRGDRAVPLLDSVARSDDPMLRAACAEAYGMIEHKNMIPRLAVLFADEDPRVRAAAFGSLVAIDSANIEFYISQTLDDPDWVVNSIGLDRIREDTLAAFLPRLLILSEKSDSLAVDIRRTLVQVSAAFLSQNPADSSALMLLIGGALDRNFLVRKEAAQVYAEVLGEDRSDLVPPARARHNLRELAGAVEKYQRNPLAIIVTNRGEFEIELFFDVAPLTVLNFVDLVTAGFYDGLTFHRVVPAFVVQGGDPRGDGWGGPDWNIRCEYSPEKYRRGTVGMATSGKDSGGSQFFVALSPQPHLEARYTVFGEVRSGMDVVDRLIPADTIKQITVHQE